MNGGESPPATPKRIIVVGAGSWAMSMHLPVMKRLVAEGKASYVGVCDLSGDRARAMAAELGSPWFLTTDEAIRNSRPQALLLLVAPGAMPALIGESISRRLPFLAEKPPAGNAETHRELALAAGYLPHLIAYNRRFSPYLREVRSWLDGIVPDVVTAVFTRHRRFDADFTTTAAHPIDTALFLAGGFPGRIRVEALPATSRSGGEPTAAVTNWFLSGWSGERTRIDIQILPDTASATERYEVRSASRSAVVSFPQPGTVDYPGFVELYEANHLHRRHSAEIAASDGSDAPTLAGIDGEHRAFLALLGGGIPSSPGDYPSSTLNDTLATQRLRDGLSAPGFSGIIDF